MLNAMNPLASFTMLIATAQSLADAVNVRDNVYLRPALATKAVAARLRSGLIVLRAFVRRLIILIALEMEWSLVDTRGAMKRPHGRVSKSHAVLNLGGLETYKDSSWLNGYGPETYQTPIGPTQINMAKLYAQLDYLAKLAADPAAKAKRLAFHMARTHEGMILAPQGPRRIAGRWGTQVSAFYDAIAMAIMEQSRNRPPPLPPPRTIWPTITAL
jgi:hypothetical protein